MIWYVATLIASVFSTRGTAAQGAHGVREEPQFVTSRAGETVILGCDVVHPLNGQPYVVEWFKFGVPIPFFINFRFYPPHVDPEYAGRASLHGKSSLRIERVRSEDQGWYECKVLMLEQQYHTFHNGSWVHLTVNAPPTFTDTPPQYVEAKEGGSITLSCTAFGNPKPSVSWLREGNPVQDSTKYKVSDGSLTLVSISREDRGAYTCRAYSEQGEAVHTTRLLVQGPPFIVSPPENITVNISQDAFFTCQAEAYPGNLTYTWFWEEDNVFFKNDLKRRVSILIDGSLIISQVKPEDAGKYTCSPSNSLGRPPSASAYLTVHYPARVINMPPVIYVAIGLPGYIRCPVDANPPVTSVKWKKDGLPLRIEKYPGWSQMEDGSIRVSEVTEDSLGTYTCVPYNSLGTMGPSPPAPLVLKDPPKFLVVPGGEYRQEAGRELVIPCEAEGDPFPNITWRKVGKPSRSKHNVLPRGSLQFKSLSKEDHGEWECVASNVATSITASTHLLVIGTSPHAPAKVHVTVSTTSANVSWDSSYDGGFEQTFSVWYGHVVKREQLGPHDWLSMPVPSGQHWLLVQGLEPETAYQFSVLAQNKLGTGPFSEVVTVNTLVFPISTPEPLVLLTPPRCLTANRTQQGVLLTWIPPANHTSPIDHYIMDFRLGERWDVLDDAIPAGETEILARDLIQEAWYEFRVMAVMEDLVSEPSNVVGVSSTDYFPPPEVPDEGLARPVVAGIVATICFLAAAILFSTLAACFVNKQRRRKLKRRRDPPLSITHCRKSVETPSSSGKISPESIRSIGPPSESSEDGLRAKKFPQSPAKEELSLYKKTKRAIISKKYSVSKHEAEATTPIELISRGPDGRFVMDPTDMETPVKARRIEGFPFVEESDLYPEFRQSDEENDDPGPMPPVMATLRPHQISPISSSQESYLQPPAYSPRFQRPMEGMTIMETSRLQATGQIRGAPHFRAFTHGQFYSYLGSPGEPEPPPPFYMPDTSPLSSVMSSPPYHLEGPFGHPTIPEEIGEGEIQHYAVSGYTLPLAHPSTSRSPDIWQRPDFTFATIEGPHFIFPPPHPLHLHPEPPLPPPLVLPPSALQPSTLQVSPYPGILQLEAPKSRPGKSPSKVKPQGLPAKRLPMQEAQSLGQLRHTSHGMGVPVLPYPDPVSHMVGPSSFGSLDTRWYELTPRLSPRQPRRMEPSMVVLQPSRLSPLTQSPISSHEGSPEIVVRPRPRPSMIQPPIPPEMSEITLQPPSSASFSRRSSPSSSPAQGQGSRRASPSYRSHMAFATSAASYPSQSPSPPVESSNIFGQMPTQRRTEEEILPSEPSPPQLSASGKRRGAPSGSAGSERIEALRYQRVKKAKKVGINNNNSKARRKTGVPPSQTQQPHTSQVLQPEEALYLRKKKKKLTRQDPYARFSALLYRRPTREDQKAILASMDTADPDHATLL
ncbi:protein turtle homolog B isoform X6 [Danio rerio]|uniref:Protein turtle homolog B isoform X6 n=1 Tax=Danio rerio TaxID=7955 RepID=A0AC58IB52_DANRE|nr:protein turtle homolog B-like isoform X2 [Danio rerio]|eukprot:XP_009293694.1 protein turtle homolog B-like isoform X2 [Danio rerio]